MPPFNGESMEKWPESTGIVKYEQRDFVSLSEVSFSRLLKCKRDVVKGCRQNLDEVLTNDEQTRQLDWRRESGDWSMRTPGHR